MCTCTSTCAHTCVHHIISLSHLPPFFLCSFSSSLLLHPSHSHTLPSSQFYRAIDEIWKPGVISARIKDTIEYQKWEKMDEKKRTAKFERSEYTIEIVETDYIVVCPLTSDLQVATGQNLYTKTYTIYTCICTCTSLLCTWGNSVFFQCSCFTVCCGHMPMPKLCIESTMYTHKYVHVMRCQYTHYSHTCILT